MHLTQPLTTAVGTMAFTLLLGLFGLIPFIYGELIVGILCFACVGLGGVALTKFGTQEYPRIVIAEPDDDKVTAVLETLADDELTDTEE